MTGPTHLTFATASSVALLQHTGAEFRWPYLFAVLVGALAPDIDSRRTALHSPSRILDWFFPSTIGRVFDVLTRMLAACCRLILSHRGVMHAPLVGLCLLCLAVALKSQILFWFSFAYCGHLALDYCTTGGIPFLFPFSKRSFSAFPIRTGSFVETLFCAGLLWYISASLYSAFEGRKLLTALGF